MTRTMARKAFILVRYRTRERGASLVEYALLVALIAIVCFAAVTFFGQETSKSFNSTADSISSS